ncbi:MAG: cation:proton antiporter [Planctomycetota bacterium]
MLIDTLLLAAGEIDPLAVDVLYVLLAAGLVTAAFGLIKQSPIPGYLIAGSLIGPSALRFIESAEELTVLGDIAVVLLMFTVGMHLDRSKIGEGLKSLLFVGTFSTLFSAVLIGVIALAFGLGMPAAIGIGLALALSSTAAILRALQARRELTRPYGRLSFGVLIIQDLLVLGVLAAIPLLAAWAGAEAEDGSTPGVLGWAGRIGGAAALIAAAVFVLPRVFGWLTRSIGHDALLVTSAALALGSGVLAWKLGFSPALGAFVTGFILASTPFKYQVSGQLGPLRELFLAVFFTSVGLQLDLAEVAPIWWVVPVGAVLVLACKFVSIGLSAWLAGTAGSVSVQTGFTLSQAGEFSLVVLAFGAAAGLFDVQAEAAAVAVVVATLVVTPSLMALGRTASSLAQGWPVAPWCPADKRLDAAAAAEPAAEVRSPRVIVGGFGPVGRAVADELSAMGARITIIELNTRTVARQSSIGRSIVFGDVTNEEVLHSAGAEHADAVVLTVPDDDATARACRLVRRLAPEARIIARATGLGKAAVARDAGADHVVVEELLTADAMARQSASKLLEWVVAPHAPAPDDRLPAALPDPDEAAI